MYFLLDGSAIYAINKQIQNNSIVHFRKSKDDLVEFCGNSVYVDLSELSTRHHARNSAIVEPTIPGAKSILLTEDNLSNYVDYSTLGSKRRMSTADLEPDLIQVCNIKVQEKLYINFCMNLDLLAKR